MGTDAGGAARKSYRIPLFILGLYLMGGAVYTFSTDDWFAGFPPQLDLLNLLPHGRYIEAAFAAALGATTVIVTLLLPKTPPSAP